MMILLLQDDKVHPHIEPQEGVDRRQAAEQLLAARGWSGITVETVEHSRV